MKTLKRLGVVVLALAMMLNMVGVSAVSLLDYSAENPFTPTFKVNPETTAPGNSVAVELYVPAEVYDVIYLTVTPGTDVSLDDITVAKSNFSSEVSDFSRAVTKNTAANNIFVEVDAAADGGATITTLPLITFTVNVGNTEVENKTLLEFAKLADMDVTIGGVGLTPDQKALSSAKVTVAAPWEVESYEAIAPISAEIGTEVADLGLPTEVTVKNSAGKTEKLAVDEWTCAEYDATAENAKVDTYTFKANVVENPAKLPYLPAEGLEVEATVTTTKIAGSATVDKATIGMKGTIAISEMIAKLPEKVTATGTNTAGKTFTEEVDITWVAADGKQPTDTITGAVGATVTFTGTAPTAKKFNVATITADVEVVSDINPDHVVAKVGVYEYGSLQEAVDNLGTETTVVLQKDTNEADKTTIAKDVTIDLNGYIYGGDIEVTAGTVTFTGNGRIDGDIKGAISVKNGAFYGDLSGATIAATGGSFPVAYKEKITAGDGKQKVTVGDRIAVINADVKATDAITVKFDAVKDAEGNKIPGVFDIVLYPNDGQIINEFVSAELTFTNASKTTGNTGDMLYTIAGTNEISAVRDLSEVNDEGKDALVQKWGFSLKDIANHNENGIATSVKLGTITFDGYGTLDLTVTAGTVHTTEVATNNEWHYVVGGAAGTTLVIDQAEITGEDAVIAEPTRNVVVNVEFVNDIKEAVDVAYNAMEVSVVGEHPTFNTDATYVKTIALGTDNTADLAKANFKVIAGYRYTFTVKGAGYRTARYTTIIDEADTDLNLYFWNNVKNESGDPYKEIEVGVSGLSAKNFLAGDIAMDNIVDKYDLAAVVSYFGTYNLAANNKADYVKYDLNRDGKIDSEDIAYVLYSIGE